MTTTEAQQFPASTIGSGTYRGKVVVQTIPVSDRQAIDDPLEARTAPADSQQGDSVPGNGERPLSAATVVQVPAGFPVSMTGDAFRANQATAHGLLPGVTVHGVDLADSSTPENPKRGYRLPPDDKRCRAKSQRSGERCRNWSIRGGTVCAQSHGGRAPQTAIAAKRRLQLADAHAAVEAMDLEPLDDVPGQLLLLAQESVQVKNQLAQRVSALSDSELVTVDRQGSQSIAALMSCYVQALKDASQLLISLQKLSIGERRIVVEEEQARQAVAALRAAVFSHYANLDYDSGERVIQAFGSEMAAVMAAAPIP